MRRALLFVLTVAFVLAAATPAMASIRRFSTWYNKTAIRNVAVRDFGYGTYQKDCLLKLANRESTYRNWVTNGSCKGLFQLKTSAPSNYWASPYWNTRQAIRYIKGRYGTPSRALAHSYRYGWY